MLDGLFGGLLSIEAKVLQIDAWDGVAGAQQVAPRPVEPRARVFRGQPFTRHGRPFLRAKPGK
jgi:hypothetical protein